MHYNLLHGRTDKNVNMTVAVAQFNSVGGKLSGESRNRAARRRQEQVIALHIAGLTRAEIGRRLDISARTVFRDLAEVGEQIQAAEQIIEDCGIDAHDVWITLSRMHDADISDILDDAGEVRPIREWPAIWRQGLAGEISIEPVMERSRDGGKDSWDKTGAHRIKIKRESLLKIIELAAKLKSVDGFAQPTPIVVQPAPVHIAIVHVAGEIPTKETKYGE